MNRSMRTALVIGIGILAITGSYWIYTTYKRNNGLFFNSPATETNVILKPYNGKYKDDPEVKKFIKEFNSRVRKHLKDIQKKTGLKPPKRTVTVELDDTFDNDAFVKPTAGTTCSRIPFSKDTGNCAEYTFKIGAKGIADGYKGRTTADQLLQHELTHVFMMWNIPNHDDLPDYVIEGLPIHVAGQEDQIRKIQNGKGFTGDNDNVDYKPGEIHVDTYAKLIDEYERHYEKNTRIFADS